ncbi:hypothetical protein RCL1_006509 [Eukaryota sp. TZLM3-RCL]
MTKSTFIGAGKNYVFEFHQRFSTALTLLRSNSSPYLSALERELDFLLLQIGLKCFPTDVQKIPVKSFPNLRFAVKMLQYLLTNELESLNYYKHLCLAKESKPAFHQFLLENNNSSSSALFTQLPHTYGLSLNNEEWETVTRLRRVLWPQQLVNGLSCKYGAGVSLFKFTSFQLQTPGLLQDFTT